MNADKTKTNFLSAFIGGSPFLFCQGANLVVMISVSSRAPLPRRVHHCGGDRRGFDRPVFSEFANHCELSQARCGAAEYFPQPELRARSYQEARPENMDRPEGPGADGFLHLRFYPEIEIARRGIGASRGDQQELPTARGRRALGEDARILVIHFEES